MYEAEVGLVAAHHLPCWHLCPHCSSWCSMLEIPTMALSVCLSQFRENLYLKIILNYPAIDVNLPTKFSLYILANFSYNLREQMLVLKFC
jgi:hypothetical protein